MRFSLVVPLVGAVVAAAGFGAVARADYANDFTINPIGTPGWSLLGTDAATRFSYNSVGGSVTAQYDTTAPTVKLQYDLGKHYTQDSSFTFGARIAIPGGTLNSPADYGGSVVCFGLVNTASTGNQRASTGFYTGPVFNEVTAGDSYNIMTMDYFPTASPDFGGNSLSLTNILSPQAGLAFNDSFKFGFALDSLLVNQFFDVKVSYDGATHQAHMDYGSGSVDSDLSGKAFDMNALGITLWNDPNLTAQSPAIPGGSPVTADVVFDSISVTDVPEPASLVLLAVSGVVLMGRRRR